MKRVAIVQSNYIPWKGYFDLIAAVDEFIIYDDVQYTRRDWRNRNQIKTKEGPRWITVPVKVKGKYHQTIRETEIDGAQWAKSHWNLISHNYCRSPYFESVAGLFEPIYLREEFIYLSSLNRRLIEVICAMLSIGTKISNSWDYELVEGKSERLAHLCVQAGASEYVSGPAAKGYIDRQVFDEREVKLTWFDYDGYPEYPQLWGAFCHNVTILDLLFNCGPEAANYLRYTRR